MAGDASRPASWRAGGRARSRRTDHLCVRSCAVQRAELAVLAGSQHPRMSGLTVVGVGGGRWSYRAAHGVIASNPAQRFAKRRGAAQTDRHHGFFALDNSSVPGPAPTTAMRAGRQIGRVAGGSRGRLSCPHNVSPPPDAVDRSFGGDPVEARGASVAGRRGVAAAALEATANLRTGLSPSWVGDVRTREDGGGRGRTRRGRMRTGLSTPARG
jgi:hypothetical protein